MMQLVHGGDWAGYRAQYGQDALDFSANVSPLGLPEGVAKAITAALATADRYPDPLCRALRAKLAVHETVAAEYLLCGNGAADLIFRLVWAAKPHCPAARPYLCRVCRRAGNGGLHHPAAFPAGKRRFFSDGDVYLRCERGHRHGIPLPAQ